MIKTIEGNILKSKANFILNPVNCSGSMDFGFPLQVKKKFPHIEKEYMRCINYCNKNDIKLFGTAQYVPTEIWALTMADTIKNNNVVDYDKDYQYIVNVFCQENSNNKKQHTDLQAFKKALLVICQMADKINATIAIPFSIGKIKCFTNWNDVNTIINKTFENSGVCVEIWKEV